MARIVPAPKTRVPRAVTRAQERGPIAGDGTFALGDAVLLFDTTAGARVATLPPIADVPAGTEFQAVISAGANNVTLTPSGSDTVEGGATFAVTPAMRTGRVISPPSGANWLLIGTAT